MFTCGWCLPTCSTQLAHVSARIVSLMRLFCCVAWDGELFHFSAISERGGKATSKSDRGLL